MTEVNSRLREPKKSHSSIFLQFLIPDASTLCPVAFAVSGPAEGPTTLKSPCRILDHFGNGAGVPSDHFPTGTINKLNGSGGPFCPSMTGELGTSAPQSARSIRGT